MEQRSAKGGWRPATQGFERYIHRIPRNRANLILPGIRADDPNYHRFLQSLAARLEETFPLSRDVGGLLTPPFSPGGWLRLHQVSGYRMNPIGIPRLGIVPKAADVLTPAHEALLDRVMDAYFRRWEVAPLSINKMSSSGPPYFSYDPQLKMSYLTMYERKASKVKALGANRDFPALLDEGVYLMSALTSRLQPTDAIKREGGKLVPKERVVATFEGGEVVADKSTEFADMFAMRVRLAVAFSASTGEFLQAIGQGWRAAALVTPVWHHTTPAHLLRSLRGFKFILGGDISNFDQNMPQRIVRRILRRMFAGWHESVLNMAEAAIGCPFVINEDRVEGEGRWRFLGDPQDAGSYEMSYGFPSGVPFVSDVGKVLGTFVDLVPLMDLGLINPEGASLILQGEHPDFVLLNCGDDFVMAFRSKEHYQAVGEYFNQNTHPYFDVQLESPCSFLGNLLCIDDHGDARVLPNLSSFLLGSLVRERGIDSPFSPYWAYGAKIKRVHYGVHPAFRLVEEALNDEFFKQFRRRYYDCIPDTDAPAGGEATQDYYNMVFLHEPSSIHWKLNPRDVSRSLLEMFFLSIPPADVLRYISPYRTARL